MSKWDNVDRTEEFYDTIKEYHSVSDFRADNEMLYRWALSKGISVKENIIKAPINNSAPRPRKNKGIDCYKVGSEKLYKHYSFINDAIRDLNMTYFHIKKVIDGELNSYDGYRFVKCGK